MNANFAESESKAAQTIPELPMSFLDFIRGLEFSDGRLSSLIDNLDVSADTKALIHSFSKATITIGKTVIKIGRKIIDFLFNLLRHFPVMTFGMAFALVLGALVASIPGIGAVLAGPATKLALGMGFVLGGLKEIEKDDFGARVTDFLDQFRPLTA